MTQCPNDTIHNFMEGFWIIFHGTKRIIMLRMSNISTYGTLMIILIIWTRDWMIIRENTMIFFHFIILIYKYGIIFLQKAC